MMIDEGITRTRSSTFSAIRFGLEGRRIGGASSLSTSVRRFLKGGESHSGRDSELAAAIAQRQVDRGSVADVQPDPSGLAPILRAVLSLGGVSDDASTGPLAGPLGLAEIQEASPSSEASTPMGRAVLSARSVVVCSLAIGDGRFHGGSRMSGDAHVRF